MTDQLSPNTMKVYEAMLKLGATSPEALRTADVITRAVGMGKNLVTNALGDLVAKGIAKRVAREKSAGYYIVKKI